MKALTVLIVGSYRPPGGTVPPFLPKDVEKKLIDEKQKGLEAFKQGHELQRFKAACRALGAAFARNGWRIMVGTPDFRDFEYTVTSHVIEGASGETLNVGAGPYPVTFYAPRDTEPRDGNVDLTDAIEKLQHLPNIHMDYEFTAKGEYKARIIPNVTKVDAVLLVGGGDGTASIGYAAHSLDRSVVAVTSFGGAAKALHEDVLSDVYDRYKEAVQLTDGELRALSARFGDAPDDKGNHESAETVVKVITKMVRARTQGIKTTRTVLGWAMGCMALLLLCWVLVYLKGASLGQPEPERRPGSSATTAGTVPPPPPTGVLHGASHGSAVVLAVASAKSSDPAPTSVAASPSRAPAVEPSVARAAAPTEQRASTETHGWSAVKAPSPFVGGLFFGLLFISSAIGTGLRMLAGYKSNEVTRLTGYSMGIELVISMTVAFGLALFYLIGGISFTGQVVAIAPDGARFAPIAVTMSLLGLAAGYIVPLDKLRDRLQKILAEEKK